MGFRKFSSDAHLVEYPALDIFTSDKLVRPAAVPPLWISRNYELSVCKKHSTQACMHALPPKRAGGCT